MSFPPPPPLNFPPPQMDLPPPPLGGDDDSLPPPALDMPPPPVDGDSLDMPPPPDFDMPPPPSLAGLPPPSLAGLPPPAFPSDSSPPLSVPAAIGLPPPSLDLPPVPAGAHSLVTSSNDKRGQSSQDKGSAHRRKPSGGTVKGTSHSLSSGASSGKSTVKSKAKETTVTTVLGETKKGIAAKDLLSEKERAYLSQLTDEQRALLQTIEATPNLAKPGAGSKTVRGKSSSKSLGSDELASVRGQKKTDRQKKVDKLSGHRGRLDLFMKRPGEGERPRRCVSVLITKRPKPHGVMRDIALHMDGMVITKRGSVKKDETPTEMGELARSPGCALAQILSVIKTEPGGIHLEPVDEGGAWQGESANYSYAVTVLAIGDGHLYETKMRVTMLDGQVSDGQDMSPAQFLQKYAKPESKK